MGVLTVLSDPILPVFAIMAFGFLAGRAGRVSLAEARTLNRMGMTVLLPILIFELNATAPIRSFDPVPVLVYAGAEAALFLAGFLIARRLLGRGPRESVLLAFSGVFANNALYVLPISILLYGKENVLPVVSVITLDSSVTFAGAMIALELMEKGRVTPGRILSTFARTPMLIAIILGLIWGWAGWAIPGPIATFLGFNGAAAAPVTLFALGVVMSGTRFRPEPSVAVFVLMKLAVFPLAVWTGIALFDAGDPQKTLYLLASAGPAGAMAFSLAVLHDVRSDAIAQIVVWTAVLTLFTLAWIA